ncbi:type I restriction enzyme, S subunit [Agreia bicolorata]|uniref:Type I restriction enzyme, S subunit n=1 Tax=Agreia bicolorata TaxID=110935 RepID=A0A1T4YG73_9MICO|nr:restriction endonuclease subunit S [Agreia bicolorata]SKB00291.1 type I restriction enzyme, S subunit [Agreia bicolorata]
MITTIGGIATVGSGSTPSRIDIENFGQTGTPWVKTGDLTNSWVVTTAEKLTPHALRKGVRVFPQNTVLVAMYGGYKQIGRTGILSSPSAVNQAISAIQVDQSLVMPEYLLHYLNHNVEAWKRFAASSRKDPNITRRDVESFPLQLPTISEQRKIANILRAWDEAIGRLQIAMDLIRSKMLDHATRSFEQMRSSEDRPYVRLGDLLSERVEVSTTSLPLLSVTQHRGVIRQAAEGRKDSSTSDRSRYKRVMPGDIAYNTMRMWQGASGVVTEEGIVSPAYTVVTPKARLIDPNFAASLFKDKRTMFDFERYSQGLTSDTWNLKYPAFAEICVPLPDLESQRSLANYLDAARQEISLLDREIELLKEQKRGLMQKLLTGEIRVTVDPTEGAAP